jgi:cellulose synthase/poly-beta-1,6-N-acetylglucosamine synthase-like glycosyltransferase
MLALEIVFWACVALLVHTHVTYPLSLAALARLRGRRRRTPDAGAGELPFVSLIVAAHDEEAVIDRRVRNALESDYPRDRLEVIVTSDGSGDRTVELAAAAGADLVLDLSRRGKVEAQNAAVERARGDVLAFSDANSFWRPDALRRLVDRLADPAVGYVCGQVAFTDEHGQNQEGAYWRYEMAVRSLESELRSVTAGNGAIYAVRAGAYVEMPSDRGHDLCLPYLMVRKGLRAVYEPEARAEELMAPTMSGEWERKRRMMNRTWGVLLHDRMLSPRGYGPLYAYEMLSHRALRYASPFLHLIAFAANLALVGEGTVYVVTLAAQLALLAAAALGRVVPAWPFRIAAYYVSVTASIAAGLIDRIRSGPAVTWEPVEGTR